MGAHLRFRERLPTPFRRLLAATWVSNAGDGIRNAALPLIAAAIDGRASTVALVAAASTLPFMLFGVIAGTLVDRHARIPLIVQAHLFRAVVVTAIAGLLAVDAMTLPVLVLGAFLLGCGEAVADSASPASIPDLVDPADLERANAELETAELVANDLAGPPVGGVLYALTPALPFVVDAVSFVTAGTLARSVDSAESHVDVAAARSWRSDLVEGVTTAWRNRVLRTTGGLIVVLQFGNVAAVAPIVVYLTQDLGLDPAAYGLFLAAGSVGGVAGARLAAPLVRTLGQFRTLTAAIVLVVGSFLLMTVPSLWAVGLGFATSFGGVVVGRIVVITARQRSVPTSLLGRAQGAMRTLVWGSATAGALAGGALADQVDPRAPFLMAAVLSAVALLAAWRPLHDIFAGDDAPVVRPEPGVPGSTR